MHIISETYYVESGYDAVPFLKDSSQSKSGTTFLTESVEIFYHRFKPLAEAKRALSRGLPVRTLHRVPHVVASVA